MRYFIFLLGLLLVSCKSETEKKEPLAEKDNVSIVSSETPPVGENSSLPRLFAADETMFLSWVEKKDTVAALYYSKLDNGAWRSPEMIISGTDWFVNWADFPAIAESNGNLLTSFLQKSADGTYTYDVKLNSFSPEEGAWKKNFILHDDGTQSEHGFVSIVPADENDFFITWLDGRETVGKGHGGGQMTLRGAFVNYDGTIAGDTLLDAKVCDCCQTTATMTTKGPIVAYRDRSDDEIRDISVVRGVDGEWLDPVTIGNDNWKIAGCPVNGPSMDAHGSNVGLAWFTAADDNAMVNASFSIDDGENFSMPVRIDSGEAIGRVDIVMLDGESAAIVWLETSGEDTLIQLIKANTDGTLGTPITVTKTSAERASGFPQMELMGDTLYIAWTSVEEEAPTIQMKRVPITVL